MQRILISGCGLISLVVWGILLTQSNSSRGSLSESLVLQKSSQKKQKRSQSKGVAAEQQKSSDNSHPGNLLGTELLRLSRQHEKIHQALQRKVSRKYKDVSNGKIIADLSELAGVPVFYDYEEFHRVGIDEKIMKGIHAAKWFLDVKEKPLEWYFHRIFEPADFDFIYKDGGVCFTTSDKARKTHEMLTYDIEPLIGNKTQDLNNGTNQNELSNHERRRRADLIIKIIQQNVPSYWKGIDEKRIGRHNKRYIKLGILNFLSPNLLVVSHTRFEQTKVAHMLQILKDAVQGSLNYGSKIVRHPDFPIEKETRVRKALNRIVSVNFKKTKLGDAVKELFDSQCVEVIFDMSELEDLDISPTKITVTLSLNNVTAGVALRTLLQRNLYLDYIIEDRDWVASTYDIRWPQEKGARKNGVLKINSKDEVYGSFFSVVYDVRDLLHGSPSKENSSSQQNTLKELIFHHTTDLWTTTDEEIGAILFYRGILVIKQTERTHNEIAALLSKLREKIKSNSVKKKTESILEKRSKIKLP